MGHNKVAKLQKCHKVRLIEAFVTCIARIDLLESREDDGDVRSELRKLKTAIFANAFNGIVTQDTQDCLDRPNTGWDAINKLAAEQNPKMGSDMLAGPVSHLVNMSLSAGVFPSAIKTALIHPVYKGGGKARKDPGSYSPVAILCALSKVLETVAKEDLEAFMKANNILPMSQHCFRKGRSCTTALATAHAAWVAAMARGKVVSVVGLDLSDAFDTVGSEDLLPKMEAMGIGGGPSSGLDPTLPARGSAWSGTARCPTW
jgi:hypothetical protein